MSLFYRSLSTYCRCVGSFVWIVLILSQTSWCKEISRWWWSIQFVWFLALWSTLRCCAWCTESRTYEIGCWGIHPCRLVSYIVPVVTVSASMRIDATMIPRAPNIMPLLRLLPPYPTTLMWWLPMWVDVLTRTRMQSLPMVSNAKNSALYETPKKEKEWH